MFLFFQAMLFFNFDELDTTARERALDIFREYNKLSFLSTCFLRNNLKILLNKNKIFTLNEPRVHFDFSFTQGNGIMFEGNFKWCGYDIEIKHSGRYCNYNSKKLILISDEDNKKKFNLIYVSICRKLERIVYDEIEWNTKNENIIENIDIDGIRFYSDGRIAKKKHKNKYSMR